MSDSNESTYTETRIIGPPGTGKTRYLIRQIELAAEKYGGDSVLVASFTKTAAQELTSRGLAVPKQNAATLHSHCYRTLDVKQIAETKVEEFNVAYPDLAVGAAKNEDEVDEPVDWSFGGNEKSDGDEWYSAAQRFRATCLPRNLWPVQVQRFAEAWEAWKHESGYLDFTDLIEHAYLDTEYAPGAPDVIFVDEAQDLSLLEMRLIKKWAKRCEHLVMAGDPFQSIFSFKGADPAVMDGTPLPKEHRPVLHQSYRVSREVHRVAMRFLELMPGYRPIEYLPTEQDGYSQICPLADWRNPEPAIDRVEQIIDRGESVMVLASCSYMIDRVKAELRSRAIPFHNPYRRRRGDWNPLVPRKGVSSADRVAAFLSQRLNGGWTMAEAQKWSDPLVDVIFRKGVKKMIRDWVIDKDGDGFVPDPDAAECSNWFRSPADAERALKRDLEWYQKHLLGSKVQPMTFPLRIADERGAGALKESPLVCIGSIHSVKGGEADHVILFPDLSPEAFAASAESEERLAEAFRVFYVGITRARQGVILCDDCGRFARGGPMPYLEEAFH